MSKVFKFCNNFLNFKLTAIHLNKNKLFSLQLKSFARSLNNINRTHLNIKENNIKENLEEDIDTRNKKNKFDFDNEKEKKENFEEEKEEENSNSNKKEKKE